MMAFYKGPGKFYDRAIRLWTSSPYSHVELVLSRQPGRFLGFSSSPRDGGVRHRWITEKPGHWLFIDTEFLASRVLPLEGAQYDWQGIILSQILHLGRSHPTKYFCSELAAYAMGWEEPQQYSPGSLLDKLVKGGAHEVGDTRTTKNLS